jgi:hypothetical protein
VSISSRRETFLPSSPAILSPVLSAFRTARGRKRETCPFVQVYSAHQSRILAVVGEKMGIATDILNMRHNQFSSVTTLIAALERLHDAPHEKIAARVFRVDEAADLVLTNVAAHAAEAMVAQQPTTSRTRRAISIRGKNRRFNSGPSTLQRPLFAALGRFVS